MVNPLPGPTSLYVNSVAISSDGQSVIAGNYFFQYSKVANHNTTSSPSLTVGIFLWNSAGKLQWQDTFPATEGTYWVALSNDGTWAAGGGLVAQGKGFINAYNAATGAKALAFTTNARVNRVALSSDGTYLVAGADSTYLFTRAGSTWSAPQIIPCAAGDHVVSVDISLDGQWIVAGTYNGFVQLIHNVGGVAGAPLSWQNTTSSIYWVAMASDGSSFAASASAKVFCFSTAGFAPAKAPAWSAMLTGCSRCGSVAISGNGSLVSAVGNTGKTGMVFLFSNKGATGPQLWSKATLHNPNSTSLDSAGQFVTVADGQPDGTPGTFYLFDAAGNLKWSCETSNMSWPMQISSGAAGIVAGSDDSSVYYFS
jgi:WD40 repeat protein